MNNAILAESGIGEIYLCGRCNNIHLSCGNFSTSFTPEGFQELEKMVVQAQKSLLIQGQWKKKEIPAHILAQN